ncbi:hypothetical protein I5P68_00440 [Serratia ureilytica]|uniref:hypothetical protein n=1 Tax=Serratia ureilytica TaxID=300181 RepID=UPI0018D9A033|nr:hypothetical protein [Serratia ureilytica]MBH2718224.1 hypothetical protein [Serratia ureilytica]
MSQYFIYPVDASERGIKLTALLGAVMHVLLHHIEQHRVGHLPFQLINHLLFTDVSVIAANIRSVDKGVYSTGQSFPDFRYRHARANAGNEPVLAAARSTSISVHPARTTVPNCGHHPRNTCIGASR